METLHRGSSNLRDLAHARMQDQSGAPAPSEARIDMDLDQWRNGHTNGDARRPPTRQAKVVQHSIMANLRRHYATALNVASYLGLGGAIYAALYLALGSAMLPWHQGWSVFLLWACAHVAGFVAIKCNLPPLLGMLIIGIVLRNLPTDPMRGLPEAWSTKIRTGGLAVILMRAGLKIDKDAFRTGGQIIARLALLPMLAEAVVDSLMFYGVLHMPIALAFTGGFILSAISPTVLVTGMLELQRRGYGEAKNIPSIEMAAASVDSICAIMGYAVASGVGIPSGNVTYSILSGPLQIVYGLIAGAVGAFVCSWTRLWDNTFKRAAVVLVTGLALMYLGLKFKYLGTGSVACLTLTILLSTFWTHGIPGVLCKGPRPWYAQDADNRLAVVWIILVQPLLFGAIGAEIDFRNISSSLVPKALLIIGVGTLVRGPTAVAVLSRSGLTLREQLFMGFSWIPKATIQGALGTAPLLLIQSNKQGDADYAQYQAWGEDILNVCVFAIILLAPIGLLVIALLGPRWLPQGAPKKPQRHEAFSSSSSGYYTSSDSESDAESLSQHSFRAAGGLLQRTGHAASSGSAAQPAWQPAR
ncbi:hypothetical protein WJX72_011662 [[Myrmecia] bisecta]|uniref:Cation/H+ exchanger transmembrane domain-containing protein n=1 Tax=[Myrmecia] bisecta TaxID=41462 RepID=A0AAW1QBE6_9CHLO